MEINIIKEYYEIRKLLQAHHAEVFLVGGCVRDMLMGRPIHDYDITTSAKPDVTMKIFKDAGYQVIPTGLQHGTITVILHNIPFEITTYRSEGTYQNHRKPDHVVFTQHVIEDLKRRDFTMNAIAYDPDTGLIDPFHGVNDIRQQCIRCVGDPNKRFQEDALRILRALRFQSTLQFTIEQETWKAIQTHAHDIHYISKERIREELNKFLMGNMQNSLQFLREANVIVEVFPGYDVIFNYEQRTPWHRYDVFQHTDIALNYTQDYPLESKLAIIFHDIGKPQCQRFDEQGIAHYYKHALISEQFAYTCLKQLTYDNQTIECVCKLIHYHDYYVTAHRRVLRRYLAKFHHNVTFALQALDVQIADDMAKNLERSQAKIDTIMECKKVLAQMIEEKDIVKPNELKVNGHDMIGIGYQGKEIGDILRQLYDQVLDDPHKNTYAYLLQEAIKHKR